MRAGSVLQRLLRAPEPSLRWKARTQVLGEEPHSRRLRALEEEVRRSRRVRAILQRKDELGRPGTYRGVYYKWQGAHWALARLADVGYPPNDPALFPMRDRVLQTWLGPSYYREHEARTRAGAYRGIGVPLIRGRFRRCASQQGNALLSISRLGLDDGRGERLVERLLHWQWPDGGWNCDRTPSADTSSFMETLLPMQGLAAFGSRQALRASRRAAEVFLRRRLFRRVSNGRIIRPDFVRLHYPSYYYYDVLAGLRGMAEVRRIADPRCVDALDLLEAKRLPDGGWPAEAKHYSYRPRQFAARSEFVDWGGASATRLNPWVTVETLGVLRAAGRLEL